MALNRDAAGTLLRTRTLQYTDGVLTGVVTEVAQA